ncbi:hypothetical protein L3Q82_021224, partial [Scortum barcoo]
AFLVPYVLLAVVCGIPLFLLETSVGQYTQEGFITSWRKMCPLAQGIGFGQVTISLCYFIYILIEAWALFYLVFSFSSELPWASCENSWNTDKCLCLQMSNSSNVTANQTNTTSAAVEFWERRVLAMSGGIEELGSVRWELALCLLACWVFCYFSIWKGVRSSGKVAYFTATFPYVMLLILLIRGLTLPGSWEGIYYYLYPDLNCLANLEVPGGPAPHAPVPPARGQKTEECVLGVGGVSDDAAGSPVDSAEVWIEAGSQIFFSYSLAAGTLNVLGSYNDYNNNCYKDCFWLCLLNSGTSFVAGFVVFSVLGFMAQKQGVTVDAVVESGPGLAFIAYPQATAMMPFPQLWTVCFFLMLILLTVDTHFVIVESLITSVTDLFPKLFRAPLRHELFVLTICVSSFLIHLTLVTEGGMYLFQLIDFYGSTRVCVNFMAICECLAVGWIFGADRLSNIIEDMTGQRPNAFFKLCWKYIIPLLSLISFILYLADYKHLRINDWYIYPDWAYALGWTMTLSSVLMVPLWAAGQMCWTAGTFRQVVSGDCRQGTTKFRLGVGRDYRQAPREFWLSLITSRGLQGCRCRETRCLSGAICSVSCGVWDTSVPTEETSVGQYTQEGFITSWRKMCPLAQGIGFGELMISLCCFIYILIEAWALFYLVFSFSSELPWATCENSWNTARCLGLQTFKSFNGTANPANQTNTTSAAVEFWERRVLAMSGGIEELGSVRWELALCLLASWVFCYFSIWKGVRSSGKVAYFTATFPYIMLLILLIRGLTLPGAWEGIYYYLDCFWLCLLNSGTSFVAGFVVFSVLGFMAQKQGVTVDAVVESGAFLVPYVLLAVVCGIPLFLLETSVGQYTQEGFITSWRKMCPLAQGAGFKTVVCIPAVGIGFGQLTISFCCSSYILIEAWALFYLVFSFSSELPWATCENTWNTANCLGLQNFNSSNVTANQTNITSAAVEFWDLILASSSSALWVTSCIPPNFSPLLRRRVLAMSGGIEELGSVRWELALCLLASWVFCYFSIWKGVRSSGKVAYFTATFPYIMLLILLIRGLTLSGAWEGIYYYLYPDLNRLSNLEVVWTEAGSQILISYSVTIGILNVLGSYNEYNSNCYRDCFWLCLLNSGTSFVAGFVVFSVLGFMAQKQGVTVDAVVESGRNLFTPTLINQLIIDFYGSTRVSQNFMALCECLAVGWIFGAFLVPYVLLAVVCGIPLFLLETSVGQYTQEGFITCWRKMCPLAQGIGYGYLVMRLYDFSYIVLQVWALFYLVFSFRSQFPWASCENTWNTANCMGLQILDFPSTNLTNKTTLEKNTPAATEFWERRVLAMSGGIEELGSVRWELALCLLASWVFCYFSIWKGVRSSGKVWIEAGSQVFFSYSLTAGTLHILASYNEYNNNCYKDCFWLCLLNSGTSFVAGFVVFSVLGFMAQKQGVTVDTVVESGPGLAFIAYPQATAMMPLPQLWTVCFFLMLIFLTVDSNFVTVESLVTTVIDLFPKLFRASLRRELFVLTICVSSFLVHLTLVTEGGMYLFQLIDFYGSTRVCANFMAICECLAVGWLFCECLSAAIWFVSCGVWDTSVPTGDVNWSVHPGRIHHLLEEVVSTGTRNWTCIFHCETFRLHLHFSSSLGSLLPGVLIQIPAPLGQPAVRTPGTQVAYFTATFPYAMLLILLIRGLTLPGAWEGIYYYLYPDLNRLANLEVWIEAGSQIFFSYSLTIGTLNVLGSYNDYNNNCYKDCFWLCLLNSGTSFVAGFVVFSVLGFMAHKQGVTVDAVSESGPGLAFIAYPQATAMMPLPQLWTVCFFLMLILLAVDTHFVTVESFITSVSDLFPKLFHGPVRREMFVLVICLTFFLIHLILVTEGGIYIFYLIDYYGCTRACHYFMALCECLVMGWIFGADCFSNIIEDMTGQRPSVFFKLCWKYIIPLLSLVSFILYLVDYKHLKINNKYTYPDWAYALGWTMTLSSVLMVPLWAAGQMCWTAGTFREVSIQTQCSPQSHTSGESSEEELRWSVLCRPAEDSAWKRRKMGEEETAVELSMSAVTT